MSNEAPKNKAGIVGYRDLSDAEKQTMNDLKHIGNSIGTVIDQLFTHPDYDKRWLAIGKTHVQEGFMALLRSIARPETFC